MRSNFWHITGKKNHHLGMDFGPIYRPLFNEIFYYLTYSVCLLYNSHSTTCYSVYPTVQTSYTMMLQCLPYCTNLIHHDVTVFALLYKSLSPWLYGVFPTIQTSFTMTLHVCPNPCTNFLIYHDVTVFALPYSYKPHSSWCYIFFPTVQI
jgi:hypothetical protein